MRTWKDYRQTLPQKPSLHDLAREGQMTTADLQGLTLEQIDQKNEKGYTPLMLAAYHGHLETCRLLARYGAAAETCDLAGSSALMGAAFKGHLDVVDWLIAMGADPDHRNQAGQSALDYARMFGRAAVVEFLKKQTNPDARFHLIDIAQGWVSIFRKGKVA